MRKKTVVIVLVILIFVLSLISYYILFINENYNDIELQRAEVREEIKNFRLKKLIKHRDLVLEKEDFDQISNRQKYVTPDNQTIKNYIASNQLTTAQEVYKKAVSWIWVSDQTLHGESEKWLFPEEFIRDTPTYSTNPVPNSIVSDCESQAYTLVSLLENIGISKQNVRVVIGLVDFSGEIGGHAWVQIYENNNWFELEVTSGPFWDDDDEELVNNNGFPFVYFKKHPYPVKEYWAFFNDRYFYNPNSGKKSSDLPNHWLQHGILLTH